MADIGYIWDEAKYLAVQRKHGVKFWEAIESLEDGLSLLEPDPQGHPDRWLNVGATAQGRLLCVVYSDERGQVLRMITAFDAPEQWRRDYERK